jgi:spore germination protein KB
VEPETIDGRQATWLMIGLILPTAFLVVPAITVKHAGQGAWLSILVAVPVGLAVARMVVSICLRFPGKSLLQCAEVILGRVPGKAVQFLYVWWFLHGAAFISDEFGSFLCAAIMPDTPPLVFFIVGTAVVAYGVRHGLEVLARYTQVFLPLTLTLLSVVLLLAVTEMKFSRLLPLLERTPAEILKGAATPMSWLGESVILGLIVPNLARPREAMAVAVRALLFVSFFLWACVAAAILVYGPVLPAGWLFPTYNVVRVVSIANFLERLDAVVVAAWMFGGFTKVGLFLYAAALGSAQALGLRDYRPLVGPLAVILVGLATLCRSVVDLRDFAARVWPAYTLLPFALGFPLLLLAVAALRRLGARKA